jgi:hypothetical protein
MRICVWAVGAALLWAVPSSVWAIETQCQDTNGSCTVSNDPVDSIDCTCEELGGGVTSGGNQWEDFDLDQLHAICEMELADLCSFGTGGDSESTTGYDPTGETMTTGATSSTTTGGAGSTGATATSSTTTGVTGSTGAMSGGTGDVGSSGGASAETGDDPDSAGDDPTTAAPPSSTMSTTSDASSSGTDGMDPDAPGAEDDVARGCSVGGRSPSSLTLGLLGLVVGFRLRSRSR